MKAIIYLLFLILSIQLVASITILQNTSFNPSLSNVTYIVNTTKYGISVAEVNETCLTVNTTVWCNSSSVDTEIYIFLSNVTVAEIPPTPPPSDGGISDSSASGGCWGLAKTYKTCYYINNKSECIRGCPDDLVCNLNYDWDSIYRETLAYCSLPISNKTKKSFKGVIEQIDTKISEILEEKIVIPLSSKPENKLYMLSMYSFLRFEHNVIQGIFRGSWIVFFIVSFLVCWLIYISQKKIRKWSKKKKVIIQKKPK